MYSAGGGGGMCVWGVLSLVIQCDQRFIMHAAAADGSIEIKYIHLRTIT
jgi:hypothetical protein